MSQNLLTIVGTERNNRLIYEAKFAVQSALTEAQTPQEKLVLLFHLLDRTCEAIVQGSDFDQLWVALDAVRARAQEIEKAFKADEGKVQ